jgi:predicted SnoaL-like aldol condensation-catalyzing enzyme
MRELFQCTYWDEAGRWLTERYLQHNPNVGSGRASLVTYFTSIRERTPTCDELETPIVAVLADGDVVIVVWPMSCDDAGGTYTSTWFDMWRIVDGKADEHWDSAMKVPTGCTTGG